jgi:hypothetical protein
MTNLNLEQMSCAISTKHMSELAKKERDSNFYQFVQNMGSQLNSANCPEKRFMSGSIENDYVDEKTNFSDKEQEILQGLFITNKNCYYERQKSNDNPWEKQFQQLLPAMNGFNIQTKSK